ncbi:MAG: hypothetical protein ACK2UL_04050, partial [Anaerolineae bacterium]
MEPRTAELVPDAAPLLERVSGARIRNELIQVFAEPDPPGALSRLAAVGALEAVAPGLTDGGADFARLLVDLRQSWADWRTAVGAGLTMAPAPDPSHGLVLWLSQHGAAGARAAGRLRLTRRHARMVEDVADLAGALGAASEDEPDPEVGGEPTGAYAVLADPGAAPSGVYRALRGYSAETLLLAWLSARDEAARGNIRRYAWELAGTRTEIGGAELSELGLAPSPSYGAVLRAVLDARLDGRVSTRSEELHLARELAARMVAGQDSAPEVDAD